MKTLLLFPVLFCAAAIQEYSDLVKRARTKTAAKSPPTATNLTPNEAFEFTMSCTGPGEELCGKAEAAFKSASTRIATEINFKKPVLVKVIFGEPATQNSPAGAQTFISKPFPAKIAGKGDQIYNFPPALVKQANLSEGKFESKLDVVIKIDPKLSWHYEPDNVNEETVYYDARLYLSDSGDSDAAVARSSSGGSRSTISEKPSELRNSGIRSNAVSVSVPMDLECIAF